jgi:hypothetical protein
MATTTTPRVGDHGFTEALGHYAEAMDRLYNGDPEPFKALYFQGDETSQCGYWGGVERGWDAVSARLDWVAAQMVPGDNAHTQEILHTSVTAEMACAVFIERVRVRLVDQPDPQQLAIRVTAFFRREGDRWKAVHRHGDSLVTKNRWARRSRVAEHGEGWKLPPLEPAVFGVTDRADAAWLRT